MSNALLSGKFLIRCYRGGNFVTATGGGHHSIDALISSATTPGPNEVFTINDSDNFKVFFFTAGNVILSARNGGGIGASLDTETFQTERIELAPDALFALTQAGQDGTFSIQTETGNFVTAVGGGGHPTRAFHTDATAASTWEKFYLLKTGDLGSGHQYAIRPTGTGNIPGKGESLSYLTALGGGGRLLNAMTANSPLVDNSKFHLSKQPDGSFAFRTPNGFNVLTADDGGGLAHGTPQMDNLITTKTTLQIQDWEKFKIAETSPGEYTIQTVSGFFLGVKNDFTNISTRISFPDQAPSIGYTAKFELIMTSV